MELSEIVVNNESTSATPPPASVAVPDPRVTALFEEAAALDVEYGALGEQAAADAVDDVPLLEGQAAQIDLLVVGLTVDVHHPAGRGALDEPHPGAAVDREPDAARGRRAVDQQLALRQRDCVDRGGEGDRGADARRLGLGDRLAQREDAVRGVADVAARGDEETPDVTGRSFVVHWRLPPPRPSRSYIVWPNGPFGSSDRLLVQWAVAPVASRRLLCYSELLQKFSEPPQLGA